MIPNKNCSTYDADTSLCTDCFTLENHFCFNSLEWIFKLSTAANSPYILEESNNQYNPDNDDYNNFKKYYLFNGGCCEFGKYWDGTTCANIVLDYCVELVTDTNTCAECEPDFSLNGGTTCTGATDDADHHSSNGKVCPNYYYYDAD